MKFEDFVIKKLEDIDKKIDVLNAFMHQEKGKAKVHAWLAGGTMSIVIFGITKLVEKL